MPFAADNGTGSLNWKQQATLNPVHAPGLGSAQEEKVDTGSNDEERYFFQAISGCQKIGERAGR